MPVPEETRAPVANISETATQEFREELASYGWLIILGGGAFDALLLYRFGAALFDSALFAVLFMAPWLALFGWFAHIRSKVQLQFWKAFAASRGWTYVENKSIIGEKALLFREGSERRVLHAIEGGLARMPLSILEYQFTTGSGKHKQTHYYTVFELVFSGSFPHLYLNNQRNGDYLPLSERLFLPRLPLPAAFEKEFKLYAPKQYEIEALQIFSPDTLQFLLDTKWPHDFELVERELIIVRPSHIETLEELERECANAERLATYLAPTLNRMNFATVGTYAPML